MATQMTLEEYKRKYGSLPERQESTFDNTPAPVQMTKEEYKAVFGSEPGVKESDEELTGFALAKENIAESRDERLGRIADNKARRDAGEQGSIETGFQTAGEALGMGFEAIFEGAKAVTPDFMEDALKRGLKDMFPDFENSPLGKALVGGQEAFDELDPRTQANVRSVAEFGLSLPIGKGATALADEAVDATKATTRAIKEGLDAKTLAKREKALFDIETRYAQSRKANAFKADEGAASRARIAQTDVLADAIDDDGLIRTLGKGGPVDQYRQQTVGGAEDLVKRGLFNEGKAVSLHEVESFLTKAIKETSLLEGKDLVTALNGIKKEIAGLRMRANALDNIGLDKLHDAKISTTKQINFQTPPEKATYRKAVAKAYKEFIEKKSDLPVKKVNAKLADYYQDIERLKSLDGKRVRGGKLGKYFASVTGNIAGGAVGASVGGGLGASAGALLGGEIAQLLKGKSMSKAFGGTTGKTAPKSEIIEQTKDKVDELGKGRDLTKADSKVTAPQGVEKTPEIRKIEKDIENNVKAQKEAIKAGNLPLIEELKDIYEKLVTKLKEVVQSIKDTPGKKGGFARLPAKTVKEVFNNYPDLTTKTLSKLEGRSTVSKQFIDDLTKSGDLKQAERELIRDVLKEEGRKVNVQTFADKIKTRLLPLDVTEVKDGWLAYEDYTLAKDLRGNVADYRERLYQSPFEVEVGSTHFAGLPAGVRDRYFAHTRFEDMSDGNSRRVLEIQSDLMQKGNLDGEINFRKGANLPDDSPVVDKEIANAMETQLRPYRNEWYSRVIREEIRNAANDGKTRLLFPRGETAMKIEKLAGDGTWHVGTREAIVDDLIPGEQITRNNTERWRIAEVLGDGKFRAVPKEKTFSKANYLSEDLGYRELPNGLVYKNTDAELFDLYGKADKSDPVYRFYEKDVQKYLTKNYKAKQVTDENGVEWIEIPITKIQGKLPVEAFGVIPFGISTASSEN